VAVLEPEPAPKGSTKPSTRYRIIPVTIFYQGQYYDASIYKASPVPMALLPETVYEAEQGGEAKGSIAVGTPSPTPSGWQADGSLTTLSMQPQQKAALAIETQPKGSDEPPRLHRGGAAQPRAASPETAPANPPAAPASQTASSGQAASSASAPAQSDEQAPPAEDPNRPMLKRGKPQGSANPALDAALPVALRSRTPGQPDLVAISDVEASDPHIYALQWPKADLERLAKAATQQAQADLAGYIKQHFAISEPAAAPRSSARSSESRRRATSPAKAAPIPLQKAAPAPPLQDVQIHYFDLDFDNNPEIVLTASHSVTGADGAAHKVFIAAVTREENASDYRPLLTYITDDTRLDEFPRLELIDAVDADGDGIGELLFRSSSSPEAEGRAFRLYAAGPDRLRIVFDSRGAQD